MTTQDYSEISAEALSRAESGQSMANYPAIYQGFAEKGIAESEIEPRVNVFTFDAWIAKGRCVKKGEHGVRVTTWIPIEDKETGEIVGKRPKTAVVFHISQTKELDASRPFKRRGNWRASSKRRDYSSNADNSWRNDPGELAADRWNESHGDRWIES